MPACASCHGAQGEGNAAAGFPRLASLPAAYTTSQLSEFAGGQRENPLMASIARALSADETAAVSAYYAALPGPVPATPAPATGPGVGLAVDGRWSDSIPACVACHGPEGVGVGTAFPPLAGQPASYVAAQLQAWRRGKRPPGPLGLMGAVARRLTASDIPALAAWVSTLSGAAGPAAPSAPAPAAPAPEAPVSDGAFQP
ncbi:MAG: c-type cytochrome, partial [Acetobacteraceae bacterium]|nr:c-type cytochrome [Acetobacteraceae bacterium]